MVWLTCLQWNKLATLLYSTVDSGLTYTSWVQRPVISVADTHTPHLTAPFPGLPRWAGTRKVEPIWILLKQETVSGSGISWARCKSAPHSRQITMPAPHSSVFYRSDALPAAQPTAGRASVADIPFYLLRLNIGIDLARFVCWSVCVCLCVCWSQPRALQKRMNRSRCPLESGVRWTQRKLVTRILPRDGTLLGDILRHARTWSIFSNLFAKGSSDASAGYITVATCFKVELEIMSISYKLR